MFHKMQHTRTPCPQCKTNTHTVYDNWHGETFCTQCGYIIHDNRIITQVDLIQQQEYRIKFIRSLWKKKKK